MSLNSPLDSLQRTPSISQLGRAPSFRNLGGSALSRTTSLSGFGRTTSAAGGFGRTVSAERSHGAPPPLPKETFQEGDFVTISAHENEAYVGMTGRVLSPEPRQRRIEVEVFLEGDSEGRKVRGSPPWQKHMMACARPYKIPSPARHTSNSEL